MKRESEEKNEKQENTIRIKSNKILAVEGKDECSFFEAILKYEEINNIQIIDIGGKDKFKVEFPNLVNLEGFSEVRALGFIRDAESQKAESAFSSICGILKKNGLPVPKNINTIISEEGRKIGIFIMPNNIDAGMLEDLCIESIKTNQVFECVEQYIECCSSHLSEKGKAFNRSKAKIQTYLASQKPIVSSLGVAAQNGYWNFKEDCFSEIKQFLHNLFKE
jgi:tRNA 2-selenouridine synthase SelU